MAKYGQREEGRAVNQQPIGGRATAMIDRGPGWTREFEAMLRAYEQSGGNPSLLRAPRIASVVVSGNQVLGANRVPGVDLEARTIPDGVWARIAIAPGTILEYPIHLCFGMLPAEGIQQILSEFDIGAAAQVEVMAHCTFPNAVKLQHRMEARIHVGSQASFSYTEAHYHGPHGGIRVFPRAKIAVDDGAQYRSAFNVLHGRVGTLDIRYEADVAARGVVEMLTRAFGSADDHITLREAMRLNGIAARGLAKTRIAVRGRARSRVFTTAEGNAPEARGHMDCTEIVRDQAVAENVPRVVVRHDRAQVTHEAAIGTVNRKELETLMARGLDEETAVDVIVRGMLGR